MYKATIIGHYGGGKEFLDGQTVKTKNITIELEKKFGVNRIQKFDTYGGKKILLKLITNISKIVKQSENIIFLPAQNGILIIAPLLLFVNKWFHRKLHYIVIGGWLPQMCIDKPKLSYLLRQLDYIYVETNTMKQNLESQGYKNVFLMPNFKNLSQLTESQLIYNKEEPYKLCTFSRVMKEKGIEDAISAVKIINEKKGRTVYSLDLYGQIDPTQIEWFECIKQDFPKYISYKGLVPFDKTVDVVKEYFALLFPTRFYTEGIPGTILDAYAAGVPIIASQWESFDDLIENGQTGFGYEFGNIFELISLLTNFAQFPDDLNKIKINCLEKSKQYTPDKVIKHLQL